MLRADASRALGLGHVVRCLAIADALRQGEREPLFLTRDEPGSAADLIGARGFAVVVAPPGLSWTDDANWTNQVCEENSAHVVFTDICHAQTLAEPEQLSVYHRLLKDRDSHVVSFDYGTGVQYESDVVICPYYLKHYPVYQSRNARQIRLLGPKYFVFRPEFTAAAGQRRNVASSVHNILVVVGGADPFGVTQIIAEGAAGVADLRPAVRVVLGPLLDRAAVAKIEARLDGKVEYELLRDPPDMAEQMLWADLAITGEGLVKYETAVTATPSIMISQFDSESDLVKDFTGLGTTRYLGRAEDLTAETLADAIRNLAGDEDARLDMSRCGRSLVDGLGLDRILASIPDEAYT